MGCLCNTIWSYRKKTYTDINWNEADQVFFYTQRSVKLPNSSRLISNLNIFNCCFFFQSQVTWGQLCSVHVFWIAWGALRDSLIHSLYGFFSSVFVPLKHILMLFCVLVCAFGLFSQIKLKELFPVDSGNKPAVRAVTVTVSI